MNIALAALCLFLLALPGILFRLAFRRLSHETPVQLQTAVEETAIGIVFAAGVHFAFIGLLILVDQILTSAIGWFWVFEDINYRHLLAIVSGEDGQMRDKALASVSESFWRVTVYLVLAAIVGALMGWGCRGLVRRFGVDLKHEWFRFPDPWFYLLRGEDIVVNRALFDLGNAKLTGSELRKSALAVVGVHATVIVQQGDKPIMYGGLLTRYHYSKGELDRIVLEQPYRIPFPEKWVSEVENVLPGNINRYDKFENLELYPISSEAIVIDYCDIKTIALRLYRGAMKPKQESNSSFPKRSVTVSGTKQPVEVTTPVVTE